MRMKREMGIVKILKKYVVFIGNNITQRQNYDIENKNGKCENSEKQVLFIGNNITQIQKYKRGCNWKER